MTQQALDIQGSITIGEGCGGCGGQNPSVALEIKSKVYLERQLTTNLTLSSDSPVSVNLGTLTGVNFLYIRASGGYVRVRVTSPQGATQSFPVDPLLILQTDDVDITAIDLTRESTVDTEVYVVLGQKA